MEEALEGGGGDGEGFCCVWGVVPAAHVCFYGRCDGGGCGDGCGVCDAGVEEFSGGGWWRGRGVRPEGAGGGADEGSGADGVEEGCVGFGVVFFAAVVQDGGGKQNAVFSGVWVAAAHFQKVEGEAYYGAGVADEAAFA